MKNLFSLVILLAAMTPAEQAVINYNERFVHAQKANTERIKARVNIWAHIFGK